MIKDHRPYAIKKAYLKLQRFYARHFLAPQLAQLGRGFTFMRPWHVELFGAPISIGQFATVIATPDKKIRLSVWPDQSGKGHITIGNYCLVCPGVRISSAAGITVADVYTSEWCRCLETAELLGLGTPVPLPPLNSFFRNYDREGPQTEALHTWLAGQQLSRPLILVTHQVNITAFSAVYPASGEVVLMRRNADGQFEVTGSVRTE